ncbi:uncharacterized, partial [Lates japonicus]
VAVLVWRWKKKTGQNGESNQGPNNNETQTRTMELEKLTNGATHHENEENPKDDGNTDSLKITLHSPEV